MQTHKRPPGYPVAAIKRHAQFAFNDDFGQRNTQYYQREVFEELSSVLMHFLPHVMRTTHNKRA
jgi:hypothetical protein